MLVLQYSGTTNLHEYLNNSFVNKNTLISENTFHIFGKFAKIKVFKDLKHELQKGYFIKECTAEVILHYSMYCIGHTSQ